VECAPIGDARSRLRSAGFEVSVLSTPVDSRCPAGTAAGTSPSGRTIKGGAVMIEVSNGKGGPPGQPETPGRPSLDDLFPNRPRR
jgi:hypothetical protein